MYSIVRTTPQNKVQHEMKRLNTNTKCNAFLQLIKYPTRFEDKGWRYFFWGHNMPTLALWFGLILSNIINVVFGYNDVLKNTLYYEKMTNGQITQVSTYDIFIYSLLMTPVKVLEYGSWWIGITLLVWKYHEPLSYFRKQFLFYTEISMVLAVFSAEFIVLFLDYENIWIDYHNGIDIELPPNSYINLRNCIRGTIIGLFQCILFWHYLPKYKQWFGFYNAFFQCKYIYGLWWIPLSIFSMVTQMPGIWITFACCCMWYPLKTWFCCANDKHRFLKLVQDTTNEDGSDDDLLNDMYSSIVNSDFIWDTLLNIASKKFEIPKDINLQNEVLLKACSDIKDEENEMELLNDKEMHIDMNKEPAKLSFYGSNLIKRMKINKLSPRIFAPRSHGHLLKILSFAVNNKLRIKAVGSKYGFTNVAFTDGALIDLSKYLYSPSLSYKPSILNANGLSIHENNDLIHCEAGTTFEKLYEFTWPMKDSNNRSNLYRDKSLNIKYKMLADTTGYNQLTLGGQINVGACGNASISKHGNIANHVLSYNMLFIDPNNEIQSVQIERSINNGAIHLKSEWDKMYPNIELIQDDDIFNCNLISCGCTGVHYSYFLKLIDAQHFLEKRLLISWKELKLLYSNTLSKQVQNGELLRMIWWLSPYTIPGDDTFSDSPPVGCMLWYKVPQKEDSEIEFKVNEDILGKIKVVPQSKYDRPEMGLLTGAMVVWVNRVFPSLIPRVLGEMLTFLMKTGIDEFDDEFGEDVGYIVPATRALSFGAFSAIPNITTGFSSKSKHMFNIIDDYIDLINNLKTKDRKQQVTSCLFVRFADNCNNGYIGMNCYDKQENMDGCVWYEQPMINYESTHSQWTEVGDTYKTVETLNTLIETFTNHEIYKAKSHLGLYYNPQNVFKTNNYKYEKFVENYKKFNSQKYFCNQWTKQTGLDTAAGF